MFLEPFLNVLSAEEVGFIALKTDFVVFIPFYDIFNECHNEFLFQLFQQFKSILNNAFTNNKDVIFSFKLQILFLHI